MKKSRFCFQLLMIIIAMSFSNEFVYAESRNISITFEDNRYHSFENNTITLSENSNNGFVTIPDFTDIVNISSDKYVKKVNEETYYFDETDGYSYTFTGWKIKGSTEYIPSSTIFQSNGIIEYDVLNVNNNATLELEAVWGRVIYIENEYTGRFYTDYWIYDKTTTLEKVKKGEYSKTGSWNYKYENGILTLNKGKDVDNPISTLDYAYYLMNQNKLSDYGNAYLNVIMLKGDLDYVKGSSGSAQQDNYFTKYTNYSKSFTDQGDTFSVEDSSYNINEHYIWGDYIAQANRFGYSNTSNANNIGVTFKSTNDAGYNLYWNGHGYSDVMYGNIRLDNVIFGSTPTGKGVKRPRNTDPVLSSTETSFTGGKNNYIEITRRTTYNNNGSYVFRPGEIQTVVLNGFYFTSWQTSWQSNISKSDYEIKWYMGGSARSGHINLGTTSAYETATNYIDKKITFTMTGGTVNGNIYGGSNARGTSDRQDRVINIIGDPSSSETATNPKITGKIFGGSNASTLEGDTYINIRGCTNINGSIYGGGYLFTATTRGSTHINISNSKIIGDVFGGGYNGNIAFDSNKKGGNTNLSIYNSTITGNIYGVGMGGTQTTTSSATVGASDTTYHWRTQPFSPPASFFESIRNVNYADYNTNWDWTYPASGFPFIITDTSSSQYGYVCSAITKYIAWTSNSANSISFGRQRTFNYLSLAYADGNVNIDIDKSTIGTSTNHKGNIYGGGSVAVVHGNVNMDIKNSTIYGTIYGGGDGSTKPSPITLYSPLNEEEYIAPKYTIEEDGTVSIVAESPKNLSSLGTFQWSNDKTLLTRDTIGFDYDKKLVYSPNTEGLGSIDGNIDVKIANSTMNQDVYGGGNAGIVGNNTKNNAQVSLQLTGGQILGDLYGGGNSADVYGSTDLILNNITVQGNVFGGGNSGNIIQNTILQATNTTVNGSLYGGGNSADVYGNTNLTIDGNSKIDIAVFGGGNSGAIGQKEKDNSTTTVNLIGGTIGNSSITNNSLVGNVYGGCNTSIVYGNTYVKIGKNALTETNATLVPSDIDIQGTIFGGGEANASGSSTYDFSFISVTLGTDIVIDGQDYTNLNIHKSIFGSGNASSTSGTSNVTIRNYGTKEQIKQNVSIQRAGEVLLKNSYIDLSGTVDSTNRYATEIFSISRIDDFEIQDSYIFLQNSTNLLKKWTSLASDGTKATKTNTLNKVYIASGNNMKVTTSEDASTFGTVSGITFMGIYNHADGNRKMGIYDYDNPIDDVALSGVYIVGAHTENYEVDGFTSNYLNDSIELKTVAPLSSGLSYVWRVGSNSTVRNITLQASSYATVGKYASVDLLASAPATEYTISSIDYSKLSPGVQVVDPANIRKVAATKEQANSQIGLSVKIKTMNGWSTSGSFKMDSNNNYTGDDQFITEYSDATPSIEIYLENSANFDRIDTFGTITLSLYGIKQNEIYYEIYEVKINITIDPSINTNQGYEASITSGKQYSSFGTTSTIINHKSSFSTMYSLTKGKNLYPDPSGLNRVLISDYVFPENTKIMLLDISDKTNPVEYYYIVDNTHTSSSYSFSNFIKLGSTNETDKFDNTKSYYKNGVYHEQFIVIVDFYDVDPTNLEGIYNEEHSLLIQLGNNLDSTTTNINNELIPQIKYRMLPGEVRFDLDGTNLSKNNIKESENIDINIVANKDATDYIDTTLSDKKMGLELSILKEQEDGTFEVLKKDKLLDKMITIDNRSYYPDMLGRYYIKINNDIVSVSKALSIDNSSLNLESGRYKIMINLINTYSGEVEGEILARKELEFTVKDNSFGLKATIPKESRVYVQDTANDLVGNHRISFDIKYSSTLENPNIRLKIYKKSIGNTEYLLTSLEEVFKNKLMIKNAKEYMVIENPTANNTFTLDYVNPIGVGTYKYVFLLYDGDEYIGEYPLQVIVHENS